MKSHNHNTGFSTLIVLGYMLPLTLFAAVFVFGVHIALDSQTRVVCHAETRILAESGIHHAAAQLISNPEFTGTQAVPLSEGAFTVTAESISAGVWKITAIGFRPDLDLMRNPTTVTATLKRDGATWVTLDWSARPGLPEAAE